MIFFEIKFLFIIVKNNHILNKNKLKKKLNIKELNFISNNWSNYKFLFKSILIIIQIFYLFSLNYFLTGFLVETGFLKALILSL
jgi:hypothetical protein